MVGGVQGGGVPPVPADGPQAARNTAGRLGFGQLISQQLEEGGLKFSAHAQSRLAERGIALTERDLQRLRQGVAQAAAKGSQECLVLKDEVAFVVSVKNLTVITAVDANAMQGNIFTNIDAAVIV